MFCSPPGSSVHGVLQARKLEWVTIPFSRGFSWPRDQTWVSYIARRFFTIWATREALLLVGLWVKGYYRTMLVNNYHSLFETDLIEAI